MGRNQIHKKNSVPLGTEYAVPNGTVKLVYLTSSTDITYLTGRVF